MENFIEDEEMFNKVRSTAINKLKEYRKSNDVSLDALELLNSFLPRNGGSESQLTGLMYMVADYGVRMTYSLLKKAKNVNSLLSHCNLFATSGMSFMSAKNYEYDEDTLEFYLRAGIKDVAGLETDCAPLEEYPWLYGSGISNSDNDSMEIVVSRLKGGYWELSNRAYIYDESLEESVGLFIGRTLMSNQEMFSFVNKYVKDGWQLCDYAGNDLEVPVQEYLGLNSKL